ncbi:TetR/AcrR family transcriptional regulator [Nocardia bovistercoris]|uniref:TetR/AcrR family transcriptional regulator n=1 Tax=Nocardia bovistercoris TaxID=2785916 RepID=A0A931IHE1_9NOCA|nr:TetR/AcrR family transcriptional regulator [Nocardia bovistercoris]
MTTSNPSPDDGADAPLAAWAQRAAERSPSVRRSRARSVEQATVIVAAARRLVLAEGKAFTTQEVSKEAGIALQTLYRHFPSKDQLLLAVFEDVIAEAAALLSEAARDLPDPVQRLRFFLVSVLQAVHVTGTPFASAEHWRLYQLFPTEMEQATRPVVDLFEQELRQAASAGQLRPSDPAADAWLAVKLVMSVFHHYAFAPGEDIGDMSERLWSFCLAAFGGSSVSRTPTVETGAR